mgnify:CR=1 FL=1
MKYTKTTYRPPYEANSLLVQATQGCSHNRCAFCTMYHDVPFAVESIEQIERDLLEARRYNPFVRRIFLLNGDAFSLDYETLSAIGEKASKFSPRSRPSPLTRRSRTSPKRATRSCKICASLDLTV